MKQEIWHGDCLELMKDIPDGCINAIICDLPYGTTVCKWDVIIPFYKLWEQYNRIIKDNGAIVLFGKEPFNSLLRTSNLSMFKYDWIWKKDTKSNFPQAGFQPLNNIEIISVFSKAYARAFPKNDTKHVSMKYNPQMEDGKNTRFQKRRKLHKFLGSIIKMGSINTSKRIPQKGFHSIR